MDKKRKVVQKGKMKKGNKNKIRAGVVVGLLGLSAFFMRSAPPGFRMAVFNQACPAKGEVGFRYLKNNCGLFRTVRSNYCVCATKKTGKLVSEINPSNIPNAQLRKFAVCSDGGRSRVGWWPVAATPPPTWNCEVIIEKALFRKSLKGVKTRLYDKLIEKCCANCDECFVTEDWGQCPYCLLDGTCDNYCLEQE